MIYKVLIEKCESEDKAQKASLVISAAFGADAENIKTNLLSNNITLKLKGASSEQVKEMCAKLKDMAVSVSVEEILEDGDKPVARQVKDNNKNIVKEDEDDDDKDYPSDLRNLVSCAKNREDIFHIENERKFIATICITLLLGVLCAFGFRNVEFENSSPDFFERLPPERAAKLVIDIPKVEEKKEDKKKEKAHSEEKTLEKRNQQVRSGGSGGGSGGAGDPRARVTQKGVLGIISGKVKGRGVIGASALTGNNFAKDIDAILENIGGLKRSGEAGSGGRKGLAGVGFGKGYGSGFGTGFGSGSGGIDDLMGGLFGSGSESISLKKRGQLKVEAPKTVSSGPMSGGRSQENIMRVVMQHIAGLRYAYNKRLKEKPGLSGKITARFSINARGDVVDCKVVNSSMGDGQLEHEIISQILRWKFDPVEKEGIAVVEYPFAFSQ